MLEIELDRELQTAPSSAEETLAMIARPAMTRPVGI